MKNRSGFTLIELLAVIVILAIIGLIAIPTAINSINNSKDKLYQEQVKRILNAADSWASSNDSKLPSNDGDAIIVTIDELQSAGLLKKGDVKNPLKGKENMSQEIVIYYDKNYNQYVSGYCDSDYWDKYYNVEEYETIKNKCEGNYINQDGETVICKPVIGDINEDGEITEEDVTLLGQIYMSNDISERDIQIGDITGDGRISNADIILLGRVLESKLKRGDVNSDGVVNNADLILLSNYYMDGDIEINKINGDMNCDGKITNTDIILLGRMIQ